MKLEKGSLSDKYINTTETMPFTDRNASLFFIISYITIMVVGIVLSATQLTSNSIHYPGQIIFISLMIFCITILLTNKTTNLFSSTAYLSLFIIFPAGISFLLVSPTTSGIIDTQINKALIPLNPIEDLELIIIITLLTQLIMAAISYTISLSLKKKKLFKKFRGVDFPHLSVFNNIHHDPATREIASHIAANNTIKNFQNLKGPLDYITILAVLINTTTLPSLISKLNNLSEYINNLLLHNKIDSVVDLYALPHHLDNLLIIHLSSYYSLLLNPISLLTVALLTLQLIISLIINTKVKEIDNYEK